MRSNRLATVVIVFAASTLAACGGPVFDEPIDGPYRLRATDLPTERMVCYGVDPCVERVPAFVVAVGANADFVAALRQRPKGDGAPSSAGDAYYYIDRKADGPTADPSVAVHGPFDLATFSAEQSRLGLPPLNKIDHIRNPRP
ncbi:MAG: hypothetical protein ACOYM5_11555 [Caulobacter sp.]